MISFHRKVFFLLIAVFLLPTPSFADGPGSSCAGRWCGARNPLNRATWGNMGATLYGGVRGLGQIGNEMAKGSILTPQGIWQMMQNGYSILGHPLVQKGLQLWDEATVGSSVYDDVAVGAMRRVPHVARYFDDSAGFLGGAIGAIGGGKEGVGKSISRFVSKWMKVGMGSHSWEIPGEVLTHGGASPASKGVDVLAGTASISTKAVSSADETVNVFARTAAISTEALPVVIARETAQQNRAIVLRDFMEVAQHESMGGNAGPGRLAVNLHVDPSTGAIRLIGNDMHDPRGHGTTIVTLLMNNIVERQQGGMKITTGFHSIGNAGKLDPTISFHIEELAGELFPMKTEFLKFR